MLVESDLQRIFGDPKNWEVLSYTGRDALVYSSAQRQDKVVKLYPHASTGDLSCYKRRTFFRSLRALLLGSVPILGTDYTVRNKVVGIGPIGEVHIGGSRYGFTISSRIHGYNLSIMTDRIHTSDQDVVKARREVWESFFLAPGVVELMTTYLDLLSSLLHLPTYQLTFSNVMPVGGDKSSSVLMITDTEAKLLSRYRVYREPLDMTRFGQ